MQSAKSEVSLGTSTIKGRLAFLTKNNIRTLGILIRLNKMICTDVGRIGDGFRNKTGLNAENGDGEADLQKLFIG